MLPEELISHICLYLDFFELQNFSYICKLFYEVSCSPTLWNNFLIQFFSQEASWNMKHYENKKHLVTCLLKRQRICGKCGKTSLEFLCKNVLREKSCAVKSISSYHSFQGQYLLKEPLELYASHPSSEFRSIRDFLQQWVPHTVCIGNKVQIRCVDPNTNITLSNYEDIMNYLRLMNFPPLN